MWIQVEEKCIRVQYFQKIHLVRRNGREMGGNLCPVYAFFSVLYIIVVVVVKSLHGIFVHGACMTFSCMWRAWHFRACGVRA